ncbi:MAG: restriction endonuclease [Streptococcaceae bacterium]|nr:restriction endonuclease [Streptococcaceae bacterium]
MIGEKELISFVGQYDYDLRKEYSRNKIPRRWMDQKCTLDVVCAVSDCVINYLDDDINKEFSKNDIWLSDYTSQYVQDIFSKPSTKNQNASNEFDKFFAQPLELLAYANVLEKMKKGRTNIYRVLNYDVLEYISLNERNALRFLQIYIEKVLKDSGIYESFEYFLQKQTSDAFNMMKSEFESFYHRFTKVKGFYEPRRIFPKVLNPISCKYKKLGTKGGVKSANVITYASLLYNQSNFRDTDTKPKEMTREEWAVKTQELINNDKNFKYQSVKAKAILRRFNNKYRDGLSELNDEFSVGKALHMHHIFPEHLYPEISMYVENLIALTPTQHLGQAHPDGYTREINMLYQELLLKAKAGNIQENIKSPNQDKIYDFFKFVKVLNIGFDEENEIRENDFARCLYVIDEHYNNMLE